MNIKGSGASLMGLSVGGGVKGSGASLQSHVQPLRRTTNDLKVEMAEAVHKKSADLTNSGSSGAECLMGEAVSGKVQKIASVANLIAANLKASDISDSVEGKCIE